MADSIGSKIIIGVVSSIGTAAILWGAAQAGGFVREVFIPELPGDPIVAFRGNCPDGWTDFEDGAGRFLLGAGEGTLVATGPHNDSRTPGQQVPLTPIQAGAQGGAEKHALEIKEMPAHNHGGSVVEAPENGFILNRYEGQAQSFEIAKGVAANPTNIGGTAVREVPVVITDAGEGIPHNNMPPYIALNFCKKEAG